MKNISNDAATELADVGEQKDLVLIAVDSENRKFTTDHQNFVHSTFTGDECKGVLLDLGRAMMDSNIGISI